MDYREVSKHLLPESFDLVVANPPYRRIYAGRVNPNQQKAVARHELTGSIQDVFRAGRYLLPVGGRLAVIYPASRLHHLMVVAHEHAFSSKKATIIYPQPSAPANLVHLECRKGGGEQLQIARPFFIRGEDGRYSEDMDRFLGGGKRNGE